LFIGCLTEEESAEDGGSELLELLTELRPSLACSQNVVEADHRLATEEVGIEVDDLYLLNGLLTIVAVLVNGKP
jgi:hypothetical protein